MKFYLGGNQWGLFDRARVTDGKEQLAGLTLPEPKTILVSTREYPQERAQTIVHELIHAVGFEYAAADIPLLGALSNDETAVEILSKEIVGALRQLGLLKE